MSIRGAARLIFLEPGSLFPPVPSLTRVSDISTLSYPRLPVTKNKKLKLFHQQDNHWNTITWWDHTSRFHTQPGLSFECCTVQSDITQWQDGWRQTSIVETVTTVAQSSGLSNDLCSYRKTENGRLPSGPPSEEIAIGRVYQNCKWKWMWAWQFCLHRQKNLDVRARN